jgi:serine protease Do
MGRTGRFLALLLFAIVAFVGSAAAQNDTTFEIVNRARVPIFEVYVSPSSLDDWGQDVLRNDVILPGARKTVRPAANDCIFDVRIVYRGGQAEERRRQNLCQLSEMAFDGGGAAAGSQAQAPQAGEQGDPSFELVNASASTITQIYASLTRERNWGPDRLGTDVLGAGRRFSVTLPNGDCIWDIAVVYADDRREEKQSQNLCNVTELAFNASGARARGAAPPAARGNAQTATGDPSFALVNRSPRTIAQLYVSRATETDWGRDRLGDNVLAAGQRFNVPLPQGPCQWDIAVVYDDDRREERRSQDLCAVAEVAFDASSARGSGTTTAPAPNSGGQARGNEQSFGTGFFISAQGHMLTNAHVAGDCQRIGVMLETGRVAAQLVRKDERNDLALIKVDVRGAVPFARFRAQPSIRAGDDIVVAGFPLPTLLQNGLNITTGNVSAMSGLGGNIALMQITAPVQPGNSGGPLLDLSGNIVGVVVSKLNAQRVAQTTGDIPQNVNFAVQGAVARLFLEAGGQRYVEAPSQRDMKAADVADQSRSFTFQIECR